MKGRLYFRKDALSMIYCLICISSCNIWSAVVMMRVAADNGTHILPVDSEHNAVFQCLDRDGTAAVERIILTASGGPFLRKSREEMRIASPE